MKQGFYVLLILGLIYFVYWYATRPPEIINVQGTIRVIEENNRNTSTGALVYKASIQGVAKNVGKFTAKNIWITYKISNVEVTAFIDELTAGNSVNFRTGICETTIKEPHFEIIGVQYSR